MLRFLRELINRKSPLFLFDRPIAAGTETASFAANQKFLEKFNKRKMFVAKKSVAAKLTVDGLVVAAKNETVASRPKQIYRKRELVFSFFID